MPSFYVYKINKNCENLHMLHCYLLVQVFVGSQNLMNLLDMCYWQFTE